MLKSLILMIAARLLMITFGAFAFIYTHFKFAARAIRKRDYKVFTSKMAWYYHEIAFADDQKGNVLCQDVFNDWFIKRQSKMRLDYGRPDHTVSHVTGVNEYRENLAFWGRLLAGILNAIDPKHTHKAMTNDQYNG